MVWFFRCIDTEVYGSSLMETLFAHLYFAGCDVQGHVISLLWMKIQSYAQTKEET